MVVFSILLDKIAGSSTTIGTTTGSSLAVATAVFSSVTSGLTALLAGRISDSTPGDTGSKAVTGSITALSTSLTTTDSVVVTASGAVATASISTGLDVCSLKRFARSLLVGLSGVKSITIGSSASASCDCSRLGTRGGRGRSRSCAPRGRRVRPRRSRYSRGGRLPLKWLVVSPSSTVKASPSSLNSPSISVAVSAVSLAGCGATLAVSTRSAFSTRLLVGAAAVTTGWLIIASPSSCSVATAG